MADLWFWCVIVPVIAKVAAGNVNCSSSAISIPPVFGARIQSITATPTRNHSIFDITMADDDPPYFDSNVTGLNFCNVTVTYLHPGRQDTVHVTVWMPLNNWNGRFQGIGGSSFVMGLGSAGLAPVVALGYAAAETDGGHGGSAEGSDPKHWALDSPGNVNLGLLQDFASTTLNDLAIIGKAVTYSFYGSPPRYSYWNGCSTGGREGLMLAQRYPDAFNGILASAPLVHWPKTPTATYWAQQVMRDLEYYPPLCELEAIRTEAIKTCDGLDGVEDGIISLPSLCGFDAKWLVGKECNSCGTNATFSSQAATLANAVWAGPHAPDGEQLWYGLNKDADFMGVANTTCSGITADTCTGLPFETGTQWIRYFLAKDPDFSLVNMSTAEYAALFHLSVQEYQSVIGTADPDLSQFRSHGGKMITIHGLADPVVPPNSTVEYYQSVLSRGSEATDFYRFFEAPGGGHCNTYLGPWPRDTISVLEKWVEHGEAPDVLKAIDPTGGIVRSLCPFPKVQRYVGGDSSKPESFQCL